MIEWQDILLRLTVAALMGAAVGVERARKDLVAGVRTHMMVCIGSALMMIVSMYGFSEVVLGDGMRYDVSRVAAQVVSGIGFIGAGTIIFLRQKVVRGLTTAAGLWTVAGVGLAVGGGMFFAAGVATVLVIFVLWGVRLIEKKIQLKPKFEFVKIVVEKKEDAIDIVNKIMEENVITIESFSMENTSKEHIISLKIRELSADKLNTIFNEIEKNSNIKHISWNQLE